MGCEFSQAGAYQSQEGGWQEDDWQEGEEGCCWGCVLEDALRSLNVYLTMLILVPIAMMYCMSYAHHAKKMLCVMIYFKWIERHASTRQS
jgi:hypothetical protein